MNELYMTDSGLFLEGFIFIVQMNICVYICVYMYMYLSHYLSVWALLKMPFLGEIEKKSSLMSPDLPKIPMTH